MDFKVGDKLKNSIAIPSSRIDKIIMVLNDGSVDILSDMGERSYIYRYDKEQQERYLRKLTPLEQIL